MSEEQEDNLCLKDNLDRARSRLWGKTDNPCLDKKDNLYLKNRQIICLKNRKITYV